MADGKGYLSRKIPMMNFNIEKYKCQMNFHTAPLVWDAILGKDWFDAVNPDIDWEHNQVSFEMFDVKHIWNCKQVPDGTPTTIQQVTNLYHLSKKKIELLPKNHGFICHLKNKEEIEFAEHLDKVISRLSQNQQQEIRKFESIFEPYNELPPHRTDMDMKIELEKDSKPTWSGLYQMSLEELNMLKEELTRLLEIGHIRKSVSAFGAPLFWVKQGEKFRLVFDFRALNKITIKDRTALPNMRELMDRLSNCKSFSKLDLQRGFNQIRVRDEDCHKLAFRTKYGHFEWVVMPFGPTNSPSVFQSAMNGILLEYIDDFCFVYIDDILIASKDEVEHLEHLKLVLNRLKENKFKIRPEKCSFFQSQIEYLGYIIGNGKIIVHPDRIKSIQEWKLPSTEHELRSFVGLANTIMPFIPKFAELSCKLTRLITTKGKNSSKPVIWTEESREAFELLRNASPAVLNMFDPALDIHLFVDWSQEFSSIGGWIGQEFNNDKEILPIAFNSQKVAPTEVNLAPYNGELLAIIQHLKKFKNYLLGRKVFLYTDQKALQHLTEAKKLTPQQQRGIDAILEFDLEIQWIPGTWNKVADYLSRKSMYSHAESQTDFEICTISKLGTDLIVDEKAIIHEYASDPGLGAIYKLLQGQIPHEKIRPWMISQKRNFSLEDGLLWYKTTRLCIPNAHNRRSDLIRLFHDSECSSHPGDTLLKASIRKYYFWPNMYKDISNFVLQCDMCQRGKIRRLTAYGQSEVTPAPIRKMDHVALDFILGLPPCTDPLTGVTYDTITIFVDALTKYVILVPGHVTDSASDVARQYVSHVVRHFGLAGTIISDRDSRFRGEYWAELHRLLGTETRLSFAHHHESVGQVERYVATVSDAIRCTCLTQDWISRLGMIQFSLNNTASSVTKETPFFLLHGQEPRTPQNSTMLDLAGEPGQTIAEMTATTELVRERFQNAQEKQVYYANRFKRPISYAPGDKVLLDTSHYHLAARSKIRTKLTFPFIGPFTVVGTVGSTGYILDLPYSMKMINEFPVSALVPYRSNLVPSHFIHPPPIHDLDDEYEVSRIYGHKIDGRIRDPLYRHKLLVAWVGYDHGHDSYEPLAHILENSLELLGQFLASDPDIAESDSFYEALYSSLT